MRDRLLGCDNILVLLSGEHSSGLLSSRVLRLIMRIRFLEWDLITQRVTI